MGMTLRVTGGTKPATWNEFHDWFIQHGLEVETRMIDGILAFPDEVPPPSYNEIRVSLNSAMVTIRRDATGFQFVTWGNPDESALRAWRILAVAAATLTGGTIDADGQSQAVEELRQQAGL